MTRVLFATRAWESPEIEGGYLLLKDIARQLSAHKAAEFEACFFSVADGADEGVSLLRAFNADGWGGARRFEFFRALFKYLRQVDVVHFAHTPTRLNALLIRGFKRLYPNVLFVQTITGFDHSDKGSRSLYWGDVVTTISTRVQGFLLEQHNIAAELLTPYPWPGRLANNAALPRELRDAFGDSQLIVFPVDVFRLDLQKIDLAEICHDLVRRHPDLQLVFLDRFGDEIAIRQLLRGLPADQLHFLPVINYMAALLERASVVAFPISDIDGKFNPPMVLLEATSLGKSVVCSSNVDLPPMELVTAVAGWDSNDWVHAISAAIGQAYAAPPAAEFDRNCYRYLGIYRSCSPQAQDPEDEVLTLALFIERLDAWARENEVPVYCRAGSFVNVDFSARRDTDIWIRAADSVALISFLDAIPATRIIHRRAANWTSHDVYVIRLAEGSVQLDVGFSRVSAAALNYASLEDFSAQAGLVELPGDVEIFSRGVKKQMRGHKVGDDELGEFADLFQQLDEDARTRLTGFLACDADQFTPERMRTLFSAAIRRGFARAAAHPIESARVARAKMSSPLWAKPFGRRSSGQIVTIIGTDGSGKSTTQELLQESLARDGYKPRYVYMGRARGNMLVTDGLKQKAESAYRKSGSERIKYIASWVYLFDYLARFAKIFYLSRVCGETVLCDRYYFDIRLMDSYSRLAYRVLAFCAPKPDVLAVLDCTVATLMRRKAERTPDEYERQRQFYMDVASDAKVRLWRGILDTDSLDSASIEEIISSLIYRASHRGYDY